MKKSILTFILCLCVAAPCFAFDKAAAMKSLMVTALVQYGETLYERGDYSEACAVFNHALTYDSHQRQALEYLKDMGYKPPQAETLDISDTQSLKQAIEAKKQSIERLKTQIMQMQSNMAYQSAI